MWSKGSSELADLASSLISDSAGYINGEMVVQDGGAHLRSSGAEDLLQWTCVVGKAADRADERRNSEGWAGRRGSYRRSRSELADCLSKKTFPGYPSLT